MTKRAFNVDGRNNHKKPKLDNEIEALWEDDDLDESVFDDFIKFDSQVVREKPHNDTSILPDYEAFKLPRKMVSSTQMEATSSKFSNYMEKISRSNDEIDTGKLRLQCEEKDGEIAVLRSQLREIKAQHNVESQKSQFEWKSKFSLTQKKIQSLKSELEFKNLDITNLKQKMLSLQRLSITHTVTNDTTGNQSSFVSKEEQVDRQKTSCNKLYPVLPIDYPLKGVVNDYMFTMIKAEKFVIENKLINSFKNAIPYLQNKTVSTRVISDKGRINMQLIYPIMLKFCEFRIEEIDSTNNIDDINKVICACLQSLDDFFDLLQEIKRNMRTEDILEADSTYLKRIKNDSEIKCLRNNELGRKSAFILNFLGEVLPYCTHLKNYFFENKHLVLTRIETFTRHLPYISTKTKHTGHDFLNRLVDVLKIIGEIRKSNIVSSFLTSTINLFTNISKLGGYENLANVVCLYSKELIFLRAPLDIIYQFSYLLKEGSRYTSFVKFLLNKSKKGCSTKKGVVCFDKDSCRFYIFVLIFDRCLSKNKTIPLEISLNLLFFMYNTYKSSYFVHHQNIKECECLLQLYNLEIQIIFKALDNYSEEVTGSAGKRKWDIFFNNKVVLKILNLMAFHCYELTEEHVAAHSQFKEIERRFRDQSVYDLQRYINEEIPEIHSSSFDNIGF